MEAIRPVKAATVFGKQGDSVRFAVQFRELTFEIEAHARQLACELFLRRKGLHRCNDFGIRKSLFKRRHETPQRHKIRAFRHVPLLFFTIPSGPQSFSSFFFLVRNMKIGFGQCRILNGSAGRRSHADGVRSVLHTLLMSLFLLHFQPQNIIADMFRIPAGTHNFQRIIPECLDPGLHIGSMLTGIVSYPNVLTHHP